jgi:hypothetical protein
MTAHPYEHRQQKEDDRRTTEAERGSAYRVRHASILPM